MRDRNEAAIIKQALRQQHIDSVFLIRQSVFASPIAWQLLLLRAMAHPQDERTVRAALLCPLFGFDAQRLIHCYAMTWRGITPLTAL